MADRKGRPPQQQQGWSALTNAQRDNSFLQRPLLPSFTRELPAPDPYQFAPPSLHPQLPSPATIPSFAGVVKQQYEAIPHPPPSYSSSSLPSACGSCFGECNHGSDAIVPLDSHALAVSRLHAHHSWADVALISDILQALDLDEDSTSAYLYSLANGNMNRVSASYDAEHFLQTQSIDDGELSCATKETSLHSYTGERNFGLDAEGGDSLSLSNPAPIEPEWEVDDIYLSTRKDALRMSRASGKHARGAYNTFTGGDHGKAKLLSKQAREERAEADRLHAVAAKQILQARNAETPRNLWRLDLHGLHVNEAVAALQQRLLEIESACFNPNHAQHVSHSRRVAEEMRPFHGPAHHGLPFSQELKVITGVRNHSRGGGSLPMAIQSFLIQNRYIWASSTGYRGIRYRLAVPFVDNHTDRFKDWVLPSSAIHWSQAKTATFYSMMSSQNELQARGEKIWQMQRTNAWWLKTVSNIWRMKMDLKSRLFMWRTYVGALPLATKLKARGFTDGK